MYMVIRSSFASYGSIKRQSGISYLDATPLPSFSGRKADGASMPRPLLLATGLLDVHSDLWGDYSATTIDPLDGSFWTVQAYATPFAEPELGAVWGTTINQIRVHR